MMYGGGDCMMWMNPGFVHWDPTMMAMPFTGYPTASPARPARRTHKDSKRKGEAQHALRKVLVQVGMEQHTDRLVAAGIRSVSDLHSVDDALLRRAGVTAVVQRRKLLRHISALVASGAAPPTPSSSCTSAGGKVLGFHRTGWSQRTDSDALSPPLSPSNETLISASIGPMSTYSQLEHSCWADDVPDDLTINTQGAATPAVDRLPSADAGAPAPAAAAVDAAAAPGAAVAGHSLAEAERAGLDQLSAYALLRHLERLGIPSDVSCREEAYARIAMYRGSQQAPRSAAHTPSGDDSGDDVECAFGMLLSPSSGDAQCPPIQGLVDPPACNPQQQQEEMRKALEPPLPQGGDLAALNDWIHQQHERLMPSSASRQACDRLRFCVQQAAQRDGGHATAKLVGSRACGSALPTSGADLVVESWTGDAAALANELVATGYTVNISADQCTVTVDPAGALTGPSHVYLSGSSHCPYRRAAAALRRRLQIAVGADADAVVVALRVLVTAGGCPDLSGTAATAMAAAAADAQQGWEHTPQGERAARLLSATLAMWAGQGAQDASPFWLPSPCDERINLAAGCLQPARVRGALLCALAMIREGPPEAAPDQLQSDLPAADTEPVPEPQPQPQPEAEAEAEAEGRCA